MCQTPCPNPGIPQAPTFLCLQVNENYQEYLPELDKRLKSIAALTPSHKP